MNNPDNFWYQPTAGEMPAVNQPRPTTAPLTQSPYSVPDITPPILPQPRYQRKRVDEASQVQKLEKYAQEIVSALKPAGSSMNDMESARIILEAYAADIMTDSSILTLALGKQQREFENLKDILVSVVIPYLIQEIAKK